MIKRIGFVAMTTVAMVGVAAVGAFAASHTGADTGVVTLAEDAGTIFKNTAIAVITALIPLAIGVYLARRALPWAKRMLGR